MGIFYLELACYFLTVTADGMHAYVQPLRYLRTFQTGVNERQHLPLSTAQYAVVAGSGEFLGNPRNGIDCIALTTEIKSERPKILQRPFNPDRCYSGADCQDWVASNCLR